MKHKEIYSSVIIGTIFIGIWAVVLIGIWLESQDTLMKIFTTIPFVGAIGCMIHVVHQRIEEVKGGNEDDLDNY